MVQKYRAGDVFSISLGTSANALCQVVWAPRGDYRNVLAFCVLERYAPVPERRAGHARPLPMRDGDKEIKVLFTGTKKIKTGHWTIIGHEALSSEARELLTFHIAGELHEGDTFVRMLSAEESARYPAMSVLGFELVQHILSEGLGSRLPEASI
jgi:hypothetical protein